MRRIETIRNITFVLAVLALLPGAFTSASAQPYTQLQILLPGETADPGSGTGKLGTPNDQTVGEPFTVTVRATDSSWNTVTTITNAVSVTSSDASATLPGPVSLSNGVGTAQVTINAAGSFTFSVTDNSDPTIPQADSAPVTALFLDGFIFSRISQKNQNAGVPMATIITAVDPGGSPVAGFSGLGGHFNQPYRRFHRLDLAKEGSQAVELMMPPMLKQSGRFRRHLPIVLIRPVSPLIDVLAEFIDNWRGGVLLVGG